MQTLVNFFSFEFGWDTAFRLAAVIASLLIAYRVPLHTSRDRLHAAGQFLIMYAAGILVHLSVFFTAQMFRELWAISYQMNWILLLIVYYALFRRERRLRKWIMGVTLLAAVFAMSEIGFAIPNLLQDDPFRPVYRWVHVLAAILIVLFSVFLRGHSLYRYHEIPAASAWNIAINAVSSFLILCIRMLSGERRTDLELQWFILLVPVMVYILSLSGYLMVYYQCKEHQERITLTLDNRLLEADRQMLQLSQQAATNLQSLRHDIKNQFRVMEIMLDEGRYDELKAFFASMNDWFRSNTGMHLSACGNVLIDSIMNMEYMKAATGKIKLTSKISVPAALPIDSSALCRVLVNLIDNALEAAAKVEEERRCVDCKIYVSGDYLFISVVNPVPEGADPTEILKMKTAKRDPESHGYGHRIVAHIVEKYNGCVRYAVEDNEFLSDVMMDLTCGEGEDGHAQDQVRSV